MVLLISLKFMMTFLRTMSVVLASTLGFGVFMISAMSLVFVVTPIMVKSPAKEIFSYRV